MVVSILALYVCHINAQNNLNKAVRLYVDWQFKEQELLVHVFFFNKVS